MPLLRTVGRTAVIAGTASSVSGRVNRRQQRKWSEQEQQQVAAPPPPAAAPVEEVSMDDKVEQLKKLAELRDAGIITEQEFGAQKAKILG